MPSANVERRIGYAVSCARAICPGSEGAVQSEVLPNGRAQPFLTSGGEAEAKVSCRRGGLILNFARGCLARC